MVQSGLGALWVLADRRAWHGRYRKLLAGQRVRKHFFDGQFRAQQGRF
jgi:hypothetical protein